MLAKLAIFRFEYFAKLGERLTVKCLSKVEFWFGMDISPSGTVGALR
jgi:hypothetical protein